MKLLWELFAKKFQNFNPTVLVVCSFWSRFFLNLNYSFRMRKLFVILILNLFISSNANSLDKTIAIFDFYKPLPEINLSIGSPITTAYESLKGNLTKGCSIQYGENMDKHGIINMNVGEYDFLNYAMKNKIQIICSDVSYKFFNESNKLKEEEVLLMFNVCNGIIVDYDISTYLDVAIYGKNPKIFNNWVKYFKRYSLKDPILEQKEIEQEFLGEKEKYATERKYWSHEIIHKNENVGFIFVQTYIKKNKKYEWSKGNNRISFKSFFSHTKRPNNC